MLNGVLLLMWLEGTAVDGATGTETGGGGGMVIHPAAAQEEQPFFDIIISVITYEAIKQTSLPISISLLDFSASSLFRPGFLWPLGPSFSPF